MIRSDPFYIEDVQSLEGCIAQELNVHHITAILDEAKYNVCSSGTADWPVLGKEAQKGSRNGFAILSLCSAAIRYVRWFGIRVSV